MRRASHFVGEGLIGVGIIHILLGCVLLSEILAAIARERVFNSIGDNVERQLTIWYLVGGGALIVLGLLARWAQRQTGTLPAVFGWGLLVIGVVGVVAMPASGFWAIVLLAVLALIASRHRYVPNRAAA